MVKNLAVRKNIYNFAVSKIIICGEVGSSAISR